jgi:RHS repeat-associated protein
MSPERLRRRIQSIANS